MEAAPRLSPSTLLPLCDDLQAAWSQSDDPRVRARLVDLMAYLVYVAEFRQFDLVRSRSSEHGDPYYDRVRSLMNYAWRIRHRDVIHYYALARRLCNAAPLQDGRPEFSLRYDKGSPVWQHGDLLSDSEVIARFQQSYAAMKADDDPTVHFSRYFDPVKVGGDDAGASHIHSTPQEDVAVSRFRRGLRGYLRSYMQPTPLMLPFNLVGEISRTIALAVRLYGNVMSGAVIAKNSRPPRAEIDSTVARLSA